MLTFFLENPQYPLLLNAPCGLAGAQGTLQGGAELICMFQSGVIVKLGLLGLVSVLSAMYCVMQWKILAATAKERSLWKGNVGTTS